MNWKIPLFKIYYDNSDVDYVCKVLKSGLFWATGEYVRKFEKLISDYIGSKYAVTFNSGTSALFSTLLAYKIRQGDKIIIPSFTFIATANVVVNVGAKPVFADIEEETLGLDPDDVLEKIDKKVKAIIAVHYAGCPCKVDELAEIASDYGLILIEDAAEAFGATLNGRKAGSFGNAGAFSFCQNKVITTGEGGAVVTNDKTIYKRLKLIRSHGRAEKHSSDYFLSISSPTYIMPGYNFRLSNILAALGVSQIKKVEKIIEMRRRNAHKLSKLLSKVEYVKPPVEPSSSRHVYQLYTIRVPSKFRNKLISYLASKGIMSKVYFSPVHEVPFYRRLLPQEIHLPVTERVSQEVLTLPMFPSMSDEEISYIADAVCNFFESI